MLRGSGEPGEPSEGMWLAAVVLGDVGRPKGGWVCSVGGEGTRHSDVTAAELGWYSIAYSPNPPTLLLTLPETGG